MEMALGNRVEQNDRAANPQSSPPLAVERRAPKDQRDPGAKSALIRTAVRGYRLVCVLPAKMSADKRAALAAIGAEVIVTPNAPPGHPDNFQTVARRLAEERGWFLTDHVPSQPGESSASP